MGKQAITFEMMVSKDSFGRRLERQIDFDLLVEKMKPYIPDTMDRTSPAVRAVLLILIEHMEPYALQYEGRPLLASIYDNWRDNTSYMWLLQGVPWDIPAYRALTNFNDIPAFEDIFSPVAACLPPDALCEILEYLLGLCASNNIKGEFPDEPLYFLMPLDATEQRGEVHRLALEYTQQFYQEMAAYRVEHNN